VKLVERGGRREAEILALLRAGPHPSRNPGQNLADMKFACLEERERLAYEAQGKWLAIFGKDLGEEFGIDLFTVIAKGLCTH